jgi:hypothetical protein
MNYVNENKHLENYRRILLLAITCCFATNLSADPVTDQAIGAMLKPFVAEYTLSKKRTTIGDIKLSLIQHENHWLFVTDAKPAGIAALFTRETIRETTGFVMQANCIKPLYYTYHRVSDKHGETRTQFDWIHGTATISNNATSETVPLQGGMLSEHLITIALMRDIPGADTHHYIALSENKEEQQTFSNAGTETVKVDAGQFNTMKIIRKHGSRETIAWHSLEHQYLPVKIERYKNGNLESQMVLKSHKTDE